MQTNIFIGKVIGLDSDYNKNEFVIRANIPNSNDNVKAYPLLSIDEPRNGDEVVLFDINPHLHNVYLYIPMRKFKGNKSFNGFEYNGFKLEVNDKGKLIIENNHENLMDLIQDLITKILNIKILVTGSYGILDPSQIPGFNQLLMDFKKLLK